MSICIYVRVYMCVCLLFLVVLMAAFTIKRIAISLPNISLIYRQIRTSLLHDNDKQNTSCINTVLLACIIGLIGLVTPINMEYTLNNLNLTKYSTTKAYQILPSAPLPQKKHSFIFLHLIQWKPSNLEALKWSNKRNSFSH